MSTREHHDRSKVPVMDQGRSSTSNLKLETGRPISPDDPIGNLSSPISPEGTSSACTSSSSVEVLSEHLSSDPDKSMLKHKLEMEVAEKKVLEGKIKSYQSLGKLYQEAKEEILLLKTKVTKSKTLDLNENKGQENFKLFINQTSDGCFTVEEDTLQWYNTEETKYLVTITVNHEYSQSGIATVDRKGYILLSSEQSKDLGSSKTSHLYLIPSRESLDINDTTWQKMTLTSLVMSSCWVIVIREGEVCETNQLCRFIQSFESYLQQLDNDSKDPQLLHTSKKWQFLLIVQNVQGTDVDDISPEDYLSSRCNDSNTDTIKCVITETFQKYFPVRKCLLQKKTSIDSLQQLTKIVNDHVDNTFEREAFSDTESLLSVINKIPSIFTLKHECDKNLWKEACCVYERYMDQTMNGASPLDKEELKQQHAAALEIAMEELRNKKEYALYDHDALELEERELKDYVNIKYQKYVQDNIKHSREKCMLLLDHYFYEIDLAIQQRTYSCPGGYEKYLQDQTTAIENYKGNPGKGPMAKHVLEEYLQSERRLSDEKRIKEPHQQKLPHDVFPELYATGGERDVMSQVEIICDTMCKSMDIPESQESLHVGKELIAFSLRAMKMEQQIKNYKILIQNLSSEIERLKKEIQEMTNEKEKESFALRQTALKEMRKENIDQLSEASTETPSTSLNIPEKEWIHVVEKNTTQEGEKQYKCDETTEREAEFQRKIKKLKEQTKELVKANNDWEKHCEEVQDHLKNQITSLMQELQDAKQNIVLQEEENRNFERGNDELRKKTEQKLSEYEDQRTKAVGFASAQASKVDELKKEMKKEQIRREDLDDKVKQMESIITIQKEEIDQLTVHNQQLKESKSQESKRSREVVQRSEATHENAEAIEKLKTKNLVLKQQVTIYKDDFDNERRDRERAQSELSTMRNTFAQLNEDIKTIKAENMTKRTEIEALKAARGQDRQKLQKKQDEILHLNDNIRQSAAANRDLQHQIDLLKRKPQQPPPYEYVPGMRQNHQVHHQERTHFIEPRAQPGLETDFLPEEWRRKITSKMNYFTINLHPNEVIIQLYARGIISYMEKQDLDAILVDYKKVEKIMIDTVLRGTKSDLAVFKQILIDTHQTDLALALPGEFNNHGQQKKWNCHVCTYENIGERVACEMCRTIAPKPGALALAIEQPPDYGEYHQVVPGRRTEQSDTDNIEWVRPAPSQYTYDLQTDGPEDENDETGAKRNS